ncbi:Glycosyl hydrolases family 43 [Spirosomataceae bacterium TFI 002]|nr:Glycosyl hydrolases family 43 [Spirosomataceae bacterium TFI 002]
MKIVLSTIFLFLILAGFESKKSINSEIEEVTFSYATLKGLEPENGVCRRDPSDVILVDGTYYFWYTKTEKQYSGYDASIWYASSTDGETWEEKGEALCRGQKGSWDEFSVFTPNILKAKDKYYLFYTGVKPTPGNPEGKFENNSDNDITAIGLAEAESPDGPFVRTSSHPVLEVSDIADDFDSYRVDDACLVFKYGMYFIYYKGRSKKYGKSGPKHTKLGVAIAGFPDGPYYKYPNNPIITSGHEVMVWPYKKGMMALLSNHGPEGKTLQFADDGLDFKKVASLGDDYPKAPGSFRVGDFKDASQQDEGISWGISMFYGNKETWPHLLKYKIKLKETN